MDDSRYSRNKLAWTAGDMAALLKALESGLTIRDISVMLGRTQEAVRGRAQKLGLLSKTKRRPSAPKG